MECVCYNIMNRLQNSLGEIISALVNNRYNSGLPSTDDGQYRPNLNLLNESNNESIDGNLFFYLCMIILAIVTFSSILSRRRRIGGNGSSLN